VLPGEEKLRLARRFDWRDLQLQADGRTLAQPGGLHLDLSGIAKGFGVDLAMHELRMLGITDALLEIGGELSGMGLRADGLPWWVDLEQPPGSAAPQCRIGLTGWSVATSGNYRRRREADGTSWPHTIAPKSSRPVDDILSVSVLHRHCMQADALATALIVLAPERGILFAERHGIPARIVLADEMLTSAAWRAWAQ
jgi:thiamine biosynthesis lipoprotein